MENLISQIPGLHIKTYKGGNYVSRSIEGTISLPAWRSFQIREGADHSSGSNDTSDGTVQLNAGDFSETVEPTLTIEQVNAYHYILAHQEQIRERMLEALLPAYNDLREEQFGDDDEENPVIRDREEFKNMIVLSTVYIHYICKEGIAYVGYEFECSWDPEHGLGIMTHKDRVIEVGQAESSFSELVAEYDLDPEKTEAEVARYKDAHLTRIKKPWWKFW